MHILTRNIDTTLVLNDGETAVLGGLMVEKETGDENKVPFLGDIPILGWLFKGSIREKQKHNLLIFITPTILRGESQQRDTKKLLGKKLEERIHFVKKYMKGRDPYGEFLGNIKKSQTLEDFSPEKTDSNEDNFVPVFPQEKEPRTFPNELDEKNEGIDSPVDFPDGEDSTETSIKGDYRKEIQNQESEEYEEEDEIEEEDVDKYEYEEEENAEEETDSEEEEADEEDEYEELEEDEIEKEETNEEEEETEEEEEKKKEEKENTEIIELLKDSPADEESSFQKNREGESIEILPKEEVLELMETESLEQEGN